MCFSVEWTGWHWLAAGAGIGASSVQSHGGPGFSRWPPSKPDAAGDEPKFPAVGALCHVGGGALAGWQSGSSEQTNQGSGQPVWEGSQDQEAVEARGAYQGQLSLIHI